jgi:hypothetical protein
MHEWKILTSRMGNDIRSPSRSQMLTVLDELFSSKRDDEHPDCWLRCGSNEGSLDVVSVYQSGRAEYVKYSDSDMTTELGRKTLSVGSAAEALALWEALIEDRI